MAIIICPACLATSHNRGDVDAAYCGACHAHHEDLPPWGFPPFESFLLQRTMHADGPSPLTEPSSAPILEAFRRLGLLDEGDRPTAAARAWAKTRRGEPLHLLPRPDYQPRRVDPASARSPA